MEKIKPKSIAESIGNVQITGKTNIEGKTEDLNPLTLFTGTEFQKIMRFMYKKCRQSYLLFKSGIHNSFCSRIFHSETQVLSNYKRSTASQAIDNSFRSSSLLKFFYFQTKIFLCVFSSFFSLQLPYVLLRKTPTVFHLKMQNTTRPTSKFHFPILSRIALPCE